MKRIFFAAAVMAALAGCTKSRIVYEDGETPISMSPVSTPAVRSVGGAIAGAAYPDNETFGVFAYYDDDANTSEAFPDASYTPANLYMDDVEFKKDQTNGYWISDPAYYWPKTGAMVFCGYSPYRTAADGSVLLNGKVYNNGGIKIEDYVNPEFEYGVPSMQNDILYFDAGKMGEMSPKKAIGVEFKHAMSMLLFNVKAGNYGADNINVKKIEILDVNNKGSFFSKGEENVAKVGAEPMWKLSSTESDKDNYIAMQSESEHTDGTAITTDGTVYPAEECGVLVIPQEWKSIKITYKIKAGNKWVEQDYTISTDDDSADEWKPGKKYTYNITMSLDPITMSPNVDTWITADDINVNI